MGPVPPHACFCLLPQCEQFVEQHMAQLQTLVSGGRDAPTTCQVRSPPSRCWDFRQLPEPPPSLAHDPQRPCSSGPRAPPEVQAQDWEVLPRCLTQKKQSQVGQEKATKEEKTRHMKRAAVRSVV